MKAEQERNTTYINYKFNARLGKVDLFPQPLVGGMQQLWWLEEKKQQQKQQ
jgi:hypothetical protein